MDDWIKLGRGGGRGERGGTGDTNKGKGKLDQTREDKGNLKHTWGGIVLAAASLLPSPGTTSRCNPIAGVPLEP
jgi:hypothetical protein